MPSVLRSSGRKAIPRPVFRATSGPESSNRRAVHFDRTGSERGEAYEGAEKRALSLSLEPCDAKNFAFAQRERNVLEAPSRQSLGFEDSGTR